MNYAHHSGIALLSIWVGACVICVGIPQAFAEDSPAPALSCPKGTAKKTETLEDGWTSHACVLPDGKEHGPGFEIHDSGGRYSGQYDKGVRHGIWRLKSSKGELFEENTYDHGALGAHVTFGDGMTTRCSGAEDKTCIYTLDCPSGTVQRDKRVAMPWEEGAPPRVVELWCESKGKSKAGPYRAWDDYGQVVAEGDFVDGKPSGRWKYRKKNTGRLAAVGVYEAGKRTGRWALYDDHDKMMWFGDYEAGVPIGKWTWEVLSDGHEGDKTGGGDVKDGKPVGKWTLPCGLTPDPEPECGSALSRHAARTPGYPVTVDFDRIEKPRRLYFEAR